MTEASLTQRLIDEMDKVKGAVTIKFADRLTTGIPDLSFTWLKQTSWWEVKFYNERPFDMPVIQLLTCKRLATAGICYYVIFSLCKNVKSTYIVTPTEFDRWDVTHWPHAAKYVMRFDGFAYKDAVEFMNECHRQERRFSA